MGIKIARKMAHTYGRKTVKAWHTNETFAKFPSFWSNPLLFVTALVKPWTPEEHAGRKRSEWVEKYGRGYSQEHATRPQTIGYSLADSPAGLLAWIYEKLVEWTDDYPWEDDEVLTWVSIYWFSRAGPAASVRIYYEMLHAGILDDIYSWWSPIPLGLSFFPKELIVVPRVWARAIGNVVQESIHERGGHFAAHEKPNELAEDVRQMFAKGGPAYGVVGGKSGYV